MIPVTILIPAKSTSQRIPHKNMVDLDGKPLIDWTLEATKLWPMSVKVVVATDDSAIA
jgi:CMP-N-acetylneuraminic acid synthetase